MDKGKQGAAMKVKELLYWLGKVKPDHEVMCCGDGCDLYSNILITDKSSIGEIWMMGADSKVMQNIDSQLGENYKEANTSRGVWHYLPQKPESSCYCMVRMKDKDFVIPAKFVQYTDYLSGKDLSFFDSCESGYDDPCIENDEIECWCGLEELSDLLDGKR